MDDKKDKMKKMIASRKAGKKVDKPDMIMEDGRRKPNPFIDLNDPKGMQKKFGKISRPRKGSKR
jgi:hypothetical protein